jgi:hypothetical protein
MITISLSGLGEFCASRIAQLKSIEQDKVLRTAVLTAIPVLHKRIHEEGKASDGSQIGKYSNPYMKVRTGNYPNNLVTKGKNKGKNNERKAGVFTKGNNKGQPRPKFNRSQDNKVIISLTKKLELSYVVKATDDGYGIGFIDASVSIANYENSLSSWDKSQYVEATYGKPIFDASKEEEDTVINTYHEEVKRRLNVH